MILGAGCAGLSLAWHLMESGVEGRIALVDRRERYVDDRTWCYWNVEPSPFDQLASHSWGRWLVADEREVVESTSDRYRYLCLRSIDFYQHVLKRIAAAPQVEVILGTEVLGHREERDRVVVDTTGGSISGAWVFDSGRMELNKRSGRGGVELIQHFLGRCVRARHDVFDPDRPMLMDFRVGQGEGPHFIYLLPFSRREALVEDTYLFPCAISPASHREEISRYLHERHGLTECDYEVVGEESGRIPMSTSLCSSRLGERVFSIGVAGGAARPSSGYAFLRIQRQTRHLARLALTGRLEEGPPPLSGAKHRFLDAVFLRVLRDRPAEVPGIFRRLFKHASPDEVVRFLGERSGAVDDLGVIRALPKWPFIQAALASGPEWMRIGERPRGAWHGKQKTLKTSFGL